MGKLKDLLIEAADAAREKKRLDTFAKLIEQLDANPDCIMHSVFYPPEGGVNANFTLLDQEFVFTLTPITEKIIK